MPGLWGGCWNLSIFVNTISFHKRYASAVSNIISLSHSTVFQCHKEPCPARSIGKENFLDLPLSIWQSLERHSILVWLKPTDLQIDPLTKCMNPAAVSHVLMKMEHKFTSLMELLVRRRRIRPHWENHWDMWTHESNNQNLQQPKKEHYRQLIYRMRSAALRLVTEK